MSSKDKLPPIVLPPGYVLPEGWRDQRRLPDQNRPPPTRAGRGAGWALGFMPLLTVAVGLVIGLVIDLLGIKNVGIELGLALLVLGLVVVFDGTMSLGLTLGWLLVYIIERFFVGMVITAAILERLAR